MHLYIYIDRCVLSSMCVYEYRELSMLSCFCSISFIMLRPVVVVGIGSPKGNARITVFFWRLLLCLSVLKNNNITNVLAAVPLRASKRARDWAPSAVWKIYNKKSALKSMRISLFLYRFFHLVVFAKAKFLFYAVVAAAMFAIDFINCCFCCFYCFN